MCIVSAASAICCFSAKSFVAVCANVVKHFGHGAEFKVLFNQKGITFHASYTFSAINAWLIE